MAETGELPKGWDYNPSAWSQRIPIVILAMIGVGIAGYLGLYQLRILENAWDPFFGEQTERILDSKLSRVVPIPDAILGAFAYLVDAVTGIIGGRTRFKTMPWMVIVFGIAVGPLGLVSILLVVAQPVMYDSWCTLCLTSAVVSLAMIGPAMDEFLASLQFLKRRHAEGYSYWTLFWRGAKAVQS